MRTDRAQRRVHALSLLAFVVAGGPAAAQHEHGVADLGMVIEGRQLAISVRGPLADFVGFEHAPESPEEQEKLDRALEFLADDALVFGLRAEAGCVIQEVRIEAFGRVRSTRSGSEAEPGTATPHAESHDAADEDHHHEEDGHADHGHAGAHPEPDSATAHADAHDAADEDHDHDHKEDGHSGHSDVEANYVWHCEAAEGIDAIVPSFVSEFPTLETLRVQILTPSGDRYLTVDATLNPIPVSAP